MAYASRSGNASLSATKETAGTPFRRTVSDATRRTTMHQCRSAQCIARVVCFTVARVTFRMYATTNELYKCKAGSVKLDSIKMFCHVVVLSKS